jgi:hypothetical protein
METAGIMDFVTSGQQHALSPELEAVCGEIADLGGALAQAVNFGSLSYEDTLQVDANAVNSWMTLAQSAAVCAYPHLREPSGSFQRAGPHAQVGGDALANMYTPDCTLQDSKTSIMEVQFLWRTQGLSALFRSHVGLRQRDYDTSANAAGLQGVKDPRGQLGMTVSPTARTSGWPATARGTDQSNALVLLEFTSIVKRNHPLSFLQYMIKIPSMAIFIHGIQCAQATIGSLLQAMNDSLIQPIPRCQQIDRICRES